MRRMFAMFSTLPLLILGFTGCSPIGDKTTSISVIYGVAAFLALLLLGGYALLAKKRNPWYLLLFSSILVVNIGYFALAISNNLEEALMANRIAYLGSVFLPLSMLMIILNITHIRFPKGLTGVLLGVATVVFLIAASPGYLPIYYADVSFVQIGGVSSLQKVYGPLHSIYLVYLFGYFAAMVSSIIYATLKEKIDSTAHAAILAIAVFVNIGVWMIEQLVYIEFEILSISYIISECFLLGLHCLMEEANRKHAALTPQPSAPHSEVPTLSQSDTAAEAEQLTLFLAGMAYLTPKEQQLYDCYVAGMATPDIMEKLNIKENTLKFHSKNLYSKLGVSSRKQLVALHRKRPMDP